MTTVTLQRIRPFQEIQSGVLIGPVTSNLYTVNGLGQVTVDDLDKANLLTQGWLPAGGGGGGAGATGPTGPPGPPGATGPTGPPGSGGGVPAGANTELQYNNSGTFGGTTGIKFLNGGLEFDLVDPLLHAAEGFAIGTYFTVTFDKLLTAPSFTDQIGFAIQMNYLQGLNIYSTISGVGQSLAKYTPIALSVNQECVGAAQHLCSSFNVNGWSGGDKFLFSQAVYYSADHIAGDEGVGFTALESGIFQKNGVYPAHISSVTRTLFSTTITANVTGSQNSQTISVASITNAAIGDWIVFNQSLIDPSGSIWASRIEAINSGPSGTWPNITCICAPSYLSGVTITPALVLGLSDMYQMGEQRLLVNLSATANYSTGQIYFGWPLVGVGNSWTTTLVGGNATNIGAVSIDQDIYSDASGPQNFISQLDYNNHLQSWYPIGSLTPGSLFTIENDIANIKTYSGNAPTQAQLFSTTCTLNASTGVVTMGSGSAPPVGTAIRFTTTGTLPTAVVVGGGFTFTMLNRVFWVASPSGSTFKLSVTSDAVTYLIGSFTGSNSGTHTVRNGGYTIAPSARILQVTPPGVAGVVCETSTAIWTVGDTVQAAICPSSYVMGWNWAFGHWNPGATLNFGISLGNSGARAWSAGLAIGQRAGSGTIGHINSDQYGWVTGIQLGSCQTGIDYHSVPTSIAAININSSAAPTNDAGTRIQWGDGYIGNNNTNVGITANMTGGTSLPGGLLNGVSISSGSNPSPNLAELEWNGWMRLSGRNNIQDPFLEFGNQSDYSGIRVQILARTSNIGGGFFGQLPGLDFAFVTSGIPGTTQRLFSLGNGLFASDGGASPFAGIPATAASTSNTTNCSSGALVFGTSVWTAGGAAALRPAILAAVPGSGVNDAPVGLHTYFYDARDRNRRVDAFSILETGVVTFGQSDPNAIATPYGVVMDPSKTTAVRTVTWPDVAGGTMVASQVSASGLTNSSAGTPGEVRKDGSNIYICFASGGGAGSWCKIAANFGF